ncbi:MAG: UMP kinase [Phycisphaerales bacterium]|jgi:uridylate kinase|nr:UMP kinase [Phycisphaerales bacterium]
MTKPTYKRAILKISGESFSSKGVLGIDPDELDIIASQIAKAVESGTQLAVVVGGGNMIRGSELSERIGIPQATADYMGMLGTVINALALKEVVEKHGQPARVMSALDIESVAEPFIRARALRHFEKGRVLILAAGTGNPFFTTDTCASLRAIELNADVLLKATKVDGVYDSDPDSNENATRFDHLTFSDAINRKIGVMDLTALSMCMEHNLPVVVFNFKNHGNICRVIEGESIGTMVTNEEPAPTSSHA